MADGLSVIIPAYNEAKRLSRTLPQLKSFFDAYEGPFEVWVIDDGSNDQTRQVVRQYQNANPHFPVYLNRQRQNRGKGFTVKEGFRRSQYPWVLFSDADLSTPLDEIRQFWPYTTTHAVIIASRDLPGARVEAQPAYRKFMGRVFSLLSNSITQLGVQDTQCGFKLFSQTAGNVIFPRMTVEGFGFDVELLYIAKKHGFGIKELPVTWINDQDSKINNFRDSIRMLSDLFWLRYNDWICNQYR